MKRRLLLWLLMVAFLWIVVTRYSEVEKLVKTLVQGEWQWVLAASFLQVIYYAVFAGLYRAAFYTVDVKSRWWDLLPVTLGSVFVDVVVPSGGASKAALFVDDAVQRGQSAARTAAGFLLATVADFAAFTLVLIVGLVELFLRSDLSVCEIAASVVLILVFAGHTGMLLLGLWQPERLRHLLGWLQSTANHLTGRLFRRVRVLDEDWAKNNASEFTQAALAMLEHPRRLGLTLAVALAAQGVDLLSLYTLFVAFHEPIKFGPLVAGFAVGVLFMVISVVPMGIGVVEVVMPLVYISLNVPTEVAMVTTLAFRGLSFWLPLALGLLLLRRLKTFNVEKRARRHVWDVRVVALLTALMGVINVVSAVTPSLPGRLAFLQQLSPLEVQRGGHLTAALAGFALLLLAGNLLRRKRVAWWLTLVFLAISIASHLLKGLDYEEAFLAGALAVWLFSLRRHFHARSDPPSVRYGLTTLVAALVFTLAYGVTGFFLLDRHFSVDFSLGAALTQTITMFTQAYDPGLQPITGFGRYFAGSIYLVGITTLFYALLMLLRPVLLRRPATASERKRARAIVESYGRSSLARLALFDDKSYYFSPGGSVVAFVAKGRIALALGDPIGPTGDMETAIAGFQAYCVQNDWQPAFYQTLPDYLEYYQVRGFDALCIGHEGIVDLATFTLEGKAAKGLRYSINHLTKLGHRAQFYQPPLPDRLGDELRAISDEWLAMVHGTEKRFSLGWFDDDYIRNSPVITVHTPEGWISAFANILPEYQRNEISIDLMRRRQDAENGTMEFLFVSLFEWAKSQGYATFNLGLSPLSGVGEHADDPAFERVLHYIYEHISQFYNFKGLRDFKEKFHPEWSPRYLVYPGAASLPAVTMAMIRADSGDDFVWDYLKVLLGR